MKTNDILIGIAGIGALIYIKKKSDVLQDVAQVTGEALSDSAWALLHPFEDDWVAPANATEAQLRIVNDPSSFAPETVASAKASLQAKGIAIPQPSIFSWEYWNPNNWQT